VQNNIEYVTISRRRVMSGGAEISKLFMCSKFISFAPDGLKITHSDLLPEVTYLKLKSSVMSASFQAWPGDLETAA
jgi:hypothetical protein